jgi:hypothetical protein
MNVPPTRAVELNVVTRSFNPNTGLTFSTGNNTILIPTIQVYTAYVVYLLNEYGLGGLCSDRVPKWHKQLQTQNKSWD